MKESLRIHASDGYPIAVTSFAPRKSNGHVVLINSATGVKQQFYSDFATRLALEGFRVFTYDYRGIGNSKPSSLKNFDARMNEWGTLDYHAVLKYVFFSYTDMKTTVIGHSVGGQIIGMSPLSENVDNIITIGAQTPYIGNFSGGLGRIKLLFFWYALIPVVTKMFGYFPASKLGLFEDLPANVARQWASWAKSRSYLFDELPSMKQRFDALHHDALMISFSDDTYAPAPAVENLMDFYSNINWAHWTFNPADFGLTRLGHFSFFRTGVGFTKWDTIMQWIMRRDAMQKTKAA
jgi:predicted alpha/beta hydrolase